MKKLEKLNEENFENFELSNETMLKLKAGKLLGVTLQGCMEQTVRDGMGDMRQVVEGDDGKVISDTTIVYGPAWPL